VVVAAAAVASAEKGKKEKEKTRSGKKKKPWGVRKKNSIVQYCNFHPPAKRTPTRVFPQQRKITGENANTHTHTHTQRIPNRMKSEEQNTLVF
jgi:hypothetical protein